MCQGPTTYHWGGTYLGVTDQCPNKELAALVLYTLCCDTDTMYKLSDETLDFVNNKAAVEKLIADGKGESQYLVALTHFRHGLTMQRRSPSVCNRVRFNIQWLP